MCFTVCLWDSLYSAWMVNDSGLKAGTYQQMTGTVGVLELN
ncbi:MAG: hypothetical protein BMS9Abin11_1546 [Gammaproteobacteria bacterium]|nr:MAG: hypothetical protein BMS9Abin11_1546 [Gammaproteobacteria bacterium]